MSKGRAFEDANYNSCSALQRLDDQGDPQVVLGYLHKQETEAQIHS